MHTKYSVFLVVASDWWTLNIPIDNANYKTFWKICWLNINIWYMCHCSVFHILKRLVLSVCHKAVQFFVFFADDKPLFSYGCPILENYDLYLLPCFVCLSWNRITVLEVRSTLGFNLGRLAKSTYSFGSYQLSKIQGNLELFIGITFFSKLSFLRQSRSLFSTNTWEPTPQAHHRSR